MARPEVEPKTALAARLREVRRFVGDPEREVFAASLGISKSTIAFYERGERTPDADVLAVYRERYSVNVNWLITGDGDMFDDPAKAPRKASSALETSTLEKLARIVTSVHRDAGIKIAPEKVTAEAAELYNELMIRVADPTDQDEMEAILPQLRHLLKKRLAEAVEQPGTGKRSA